MRRKIVAVWISLAIVLSFIVIIFEIVTVVKAPTIIYVDDVPGEGPSNPAENYTNIQDAIDNANDGDTIFVYNGTYYGYADIYKTISLIGENKNTTILNGNHDGWVLNVYANWVNITGFKITNGHYGISVVSSYNNIFGNNIIDCIDCGVLLDQSFSNNISNNNFVNNGVWIYGGELAHYNSHTILSNNTVNGKPLKYYKDSNGIEINGDQIGQLILANCMDFNVRNLHINNTDVGIEVAFSTNVIMTNNNLSNNLQGIILDFSSYNAITINSVLNCRRGIYFRYSSNNVITNNFISERGGGIHFTISPYNTITYNNILNKAYSLYLYSSSYNSIHHNNIINSTTQPYDNSGDNYWDNGYPSGGNYWSDYDGVDLNSTPTQNVPPPDGIGDTPYTDFDGWSGAQDNYPLMRPFINYTYLYKGWNLISIPFIQSDTNLGTVLSDISGSYSAVQRYDTADKRDNWKHNQTSKPSHLNDLDDIDHIIGFWIHITEPGGVSFQYLGIQPTSNQTIQLYSGWNMVGYPSLTSYNRTQGLNNLTFDSEVDAIWTFDAELQKWVEIGEGDFFEMGRGYWIHATTECMWEVPL